MSQIAQHFKPNLSIIKQCREQIGMTQQQVKKKVKAIEAIEVGNKRPTYKQLYDLADLYQVPRWVFIADELPQEYQYNNKPWFRKFRDSPSFDNYKIRQLVARVEQYRDLFIELRNGLDDPIQSFDSPLFQADREDSIERIANRVREWLVIPNDGLDFPQLKERVEQKGVFIFLTSKFMGWANIDESFRGLAINHETVPIIIINKSDSRKAQSFTLIHELGHIIRRDTRIDGNNTDDPEIEQWCNKFAGQILMPSTSEVWQQWQQHEHPELAEVKKLAANFKVSPHACLVRLRQLDKISQQTYIDFEDELVKEFKKLQDKYKNSHGGPSRNRSQEVCEQFGSAFVSTVLTTWHNQEMTLHKAAKLLGLKRPQQLFNLQDSL